MFGKFKKNKTYIIAEIGGNFVNFNQAKLIIDHAKKCGVDAIKLQTYEADTITSKKANFDMENVGYVSQYNTFKKYQIDYDLHKLIFNYIDQLKLDWFSTPSHKKDVDMLETLNVIAHKIGSDDAVNFPFLKYVAKTKKPIILSTGMCTLDEVSQAVDTILSTGNEKLILLHAITSYPTHSDNVNLKAIQTLKREFPEIPVGYSDHTLSPIASLCSVAMGANVIERHFTHDKKADGPDHQLSSDPKEMKWLVDSIRSFEKMRGTGVKKPAKSETITRINNRKSIVITKDIKLGDILSIDNIDIKRPGYGLEPKYFEMLLGKQVKSSLKKEDILRWHDIK